MAKIAVIGECMAELYAQNNGYIQTFAGDTFNCAVYLKRCSKNDDIEYTLENLEKKIRSAKALNSRIILN